MNEFSHNGITITLGSDATFSAQVGGKFVRKQSLAASAICKLIEQAQAASLTAALEQSIAAILSLPDSVVPMSPQEIAEVVRKADSQITQEKL